eukprot:3167808-Prymnesium_polylepis.1
MACRALAAISRAMFAVAYYLSFVHHQRLNFGALHDATDPYAATTIGGLGPMPNACFSTSDLMWGALVLYSKHGFLAIATGTHLAACACLFIRRRRRCVVWLATSLVVAGAGGGTASALKLYGFPISLEAMRTAQSLLFTLGTGTASAFVMAALKEKRKKRRRG